MELSLQSALESPWLYDRVQSVVGGVDELRRRVAPHLAAFTNGTVLDVGAGTGNFASLVPDSSDYVALDPDPRKLDRLKTKFPGARTIQGSATGLEFPDDSVEYGVCIDVSHHLSDAELPLLFGELRRVLTRALVFVDALRTPSPRSRLLWSIDRGSHPRPRAELLAAIERDLRIESVEDFRIHHTYVLCICTPQA